MTLPSIDLDYLQLFLVGLLNTPSPTGFTDAAIKFTEETLAKFPNIKLSRTRKGALLVALPGKQHDAPRALTSHVDTLGAMVKEIKPNGRMRLTQLGGFSWNSVEGEGCTIFTSDDRKYRGSILIDKASVHVYGRQADLKREDETMEIRLDEVATTHDQVRLLGIDVGDFVAFDPRTEVINNFVRSRHLDDKASVACLIAAAKALADAGLQPEQDTYMLISNFEEVGHGAAAGIPDEVTELVVVDMAAIGDGQTSDEFHASLCVKDTGGPYHHGLSQHLRQLADANQIPYKVDIYPHYGSDGEAFWSAGGNVAVALIGPGVDASHHYERTHLDALDATTRWVLAYLLSE
ncbi:MAG TPA: M42 family metallopeptidase [Longilinea sp.]|nr:M42 family metallopeptidase [Longilinea sp.]